MIKYLAGLVLGLTIGGVFFHYQVQKVDYYSFRVGYMAGRVDAEGPAILPMACHIYSQYNLGNHPFGYTLSRSDRELKELCQNPPSNPIQLSPEQ